MSKFATSTLTPSTASLPRKPVFALTLLLTLSLVALLVIGFWIGPPTADLWGWLSGDMPAAGDTANDNGIPSYLFALRLPRLLSVALVGAGLGLSGALLQGLFRNPLADPSLLGVSAGAAVGASLMFTFLPWLLGWLSSLASDVNSQNSPNSPNSLGDINDLFVYLADGLVAVAACFAGLFTVLLVLFVSGGLSITKRSKRNQPMSNITMLLVGIAVNAIGFAIVGSLSYLASNEVLRDILSWSLGSFEGTSWWAVLVLSPIVLLGVWICWWAAKPLDLLALGESEAKQLGLNVRRTQWLVVAVAAVLTGLGVAVAGIIGFIGLVAPHIIRLSLGAQHRLLLPLSMLCGAMLLLAAEILARTIAAPILLPVGVLTAALGAPLFLLLVLRVQRIGQLPQ